MDEQPFYRVLDEGTTASGAVIASVDNMEIAVSMPANVDVNGSPNVVANEDVNVSVADEDSLLDVSTNDVLNGSA